MSEETREARRLDRRGFLGAAAGGDARGAAAWPMAWGGKSKASATDCAEVPLQGLTKARRGAIHYTTPAQAWNTTALFQDFMTFMKSINCNAWEFAGGYPTVLPGINGGTGTGNGWIALGSHAKANGFRLVGTHDGPAPTS